MPGSDNEVIIHTPAPSESSSSSVWSYVTSSVSAAVSGISDAGGYVASSTYNAGAYVASSVSGATTNLAYYAVPDSELRSPGSDAAYYTALKTSIPVAATVGAAFVSLAAAPALPIVAGAAGISLGIAHLAGNIGSRSYQLMFGAKDLTTEIRLLNQGYHSLAIIQESVSAINENMTIIANSLPAGFLNSIDLSGLGILTNLVGLKKESHVKARDALMNNQNVDCIAIMQALYVMRKNIDALNKQYEYLSQEQASIQAAVENIKNAAVAGPASQDFQAWWGQPGMDWQQIPVMIAGLAKKLDQFELVAKYEMIHDAVKPYSQAYLKAMAAPENLESVANSMVNAVINTLILSASNQSGATAQKKVERFADDFIQVMCTGAFVNGVLEAGGANADVVGVAKLYNKQTNAKIQSLLVQLSQKLNLSQSNISYMAGAGAQAAILMSAGPSALAGASAALAAPDIAKFLAHNTTRNELVALFTSNSAQATQLEVRDLMIQIMQYVLISQEEQLLNGEIDVPVIASNNLELLQECAQAGSEMGASLCVEIPHYLNRTAAQALGQPDLDVTSAIIEPGYFASLQARLKEGAIGAVRSVVSRIKGTPDVQEEYKPPRLK